MIYVKSNHPLIGDSLSFVPFLLALAEKHGEVCVTGIFSEAVKPLIDRMPITFRIQDQHTPGLKTDVTAALGYCHSQRRDLHMAQSYFALNHMPIPEVPMRLDMVVDDTAFLRSQPLPYAVISPFSRSDAGHNKLWYEDRWAQVITRLRQSYGREVFVLGDDKDNFYAYINAGAVPIRNRALPEVLSVIRHADVLITIDNGISHLAHFGGVDRHVLLYPMCLSKAWVDNPLAKKIYGRPSDITPAQVLGAAEAVTGRWLG
jgi:ADP-heptose:LPS heptosyltransferase